MKMSSKSLLDDIIIQLLNTSSSSGKETITLQKKLQEFKDAISDKQQKEINLRTEYINKHESFRKEKEKAYEKYMEEYHQLRKDYENATENRKIEALHKWLLYSINIPEVLQNESSKIYTTMP